MKIKTFHLTALAALSLVSSMSMAEGPQPHPRPERGDRDGAEMHGSFGHSSYEARGGRMAWMKQRMDEIRNEREAVMAKTDVCLQHAATVPDARKCVANERAAMAEFHAKLRDETVEHREMMKARRADRARVHDEKHSELHP